VSPLREAPPPLAAAAARVPAAAPAPAPAPAKALSFAVFSEEDAADADADADADAGGGDENAAPPGVHRDATATARLQAQLRRIAAGGAATPLSPVAPETLPGGSAGSVQLLEGAAHSHALAEPGHFGAAGRAAALPRMSALQERAADFEIWTEEGPSRSGVAGGGGGSLSGLSLSLGEE
jgi:hypothetical protein